MIVLVVVVAVVLLAVSDIIVLGEKGGLRVIS